MTEAFAVATMTETELFEALKAVLGEDLLATSGAGPDAAAWVKATRAREALCLLKEKLGFNLLVDHTAADLLRWPKSQRIGVWDPCQATQGTAWTEPEVHEHRFELTWRLMRLDASTGLVGGRAALKCRLEEGEAAPPSSRDLWPVADWLEREVWDMFGIKPSDRPDVKRLLLYQEFEGHPLRKDYPIAKRQPLIEPLKPSPKRIRPEDLRPRLA
ncbi:MAG: NADH-quinone oxidoreductase subunit C [Elusimicrobia bacterium]|nr:NADH-quinone oxidoreductase subunit C [Elusimicrobiota bacterium]